MHPGKVWAGRVPRLPAPGGVATRIAAPAFAVLAGCGGEGSPTAPEPPPPPAVRVSFAAESLEVREEETVTVRIGYQVRSLDAPWRLGLSALPGSASDEDFDLAADHIEVPAGQGVSGEAVVEFTATPDAIFDEGEETVAIRLVQDPAVRAVYGADLPVVISDGGVFPCPAVHVIGAPPAANLPAIGWTERGLSVRISADPEGAAMAFQGPYLPPHPDQQVGWTVNSTFFANLASWEIQAEDDALRHEIVVLQPHQSPEGREPDNPDFRFGFVGGGCEGATLRCSLTSCEMQPPT